jgi:hypothetical protein
MFFIEIRYSARGNLRSQINGARGGRASLGTIHSAKMAIGRGEARTNSLLSPLGMQKSGIGDRQDAGDSGFCPMKPAPCRTLLRCGTDARFPYENPADCRD